MNAASLALAAAFTLAIGWFVLGTAWRVRVWLVTPSPLPIPLAPAPRGRAGVAARLTVEILLFRSLARASLATWAPAILFHYGLLVVLIVHLRFLFPVLPTWLVPFLVASGWATLATALGLGALLARRAFVDRVRRVSAPSDYLHVVLLLAIVASGAALKRLWPVELYPVGEFVRGVATLDWQPLPLAGTMPHAGLLVHLLGVLALLLVFPISKLVHAPGIAFAPTFHQRDPGSRVGGQRSGGQRPRAPEPSGAPRSGARDGAADPVATRGERPLARRDGRVETGKVDGGADEGAAPGHERP